MTEPETYWRRWETGMLGGKHRQGRIRWWGWLLAIAATAIAAVAGYFLGGMSP